MNKDDLKPGSADVVDVYIGQARTLQKGGTLKAILGSCVGVGLFWKNQKSFGLAHCLLPEQLAKEKTTDARYVNHGILSLIDLMKIPSTSYGEIEAVIAGGGNMTAPTSRQPHQLVGAQNSLAAKKWLQKLGIKLVHEEIGGDQGRRIFVFGDDGTFHIERIPRLDAA